MTTDSQERIILRMAITYLSVKVSSPADPKKATQLEFVIDSGAAYSVIPKHILANLKIKPEEKREFILANGQKIVRQIGGARFEYSNHKGHAPVIFGEKSDSTLLGATTLEAMGFALDPLKRELIPLPMML